MSGGRTARARRGRPNRPRRPKGRSRVGERFEAEVGPVAHGGHCVVRLPGSSEGPDSSTGSSTGPESRVVFVRHALPGERVVVEITEGTDGDRFWRGDAVTVLTPSPDRVAPPCPYAHPGGCGGCDFQHVDPAAQRALKAEVVREQLSRLAHLEREVTVEEVTPTLRWRSRMRYVELPGGRRGLHAHRSDEVVEIDDCLIDARAPWPDGEPGDDEPVVPSETTETVETAHGTHAFSVAADGFWQPHVEAPRVLVETLLEMLRPQPGERALDLFAGVGLFAAFLADAVGPDGRVVAVEGSRDACLHARGNLPRTVEVGCGRVDRVLAASYDDPFDLVVLDPPREGARRAVVEQIVDRAPRAVAYVACDPAALARDLATFGELGYRLVDLRAFDLFPMTHHVECVALLERA